MNITEQDQRLVTTDQVREFESKLNRVLQFAEIADMRLARLGNAHNLETLGGWPDDFEFPTEAVAGYALMADALDEGAEQMLKWAKQMREQSTHLWFVRGPAAEGG